HTINATLLLHYPDHTVTDAKYYYFFFIATATTEIYTLSLHDALPISGHTIPRAAGWRSPKSAGGSPSPPPPRADLCHNRADRTRSEEHTSELQSRGHLVCRLLLEKKKGK